MTPAERSLHDLLHEVASGAPRADVRSALVEAGAQTLTAVSTYLRHADLPIEAVERIEDVVKQTMSSLMGTGLTGSKAAELAELQKELGLLPKFKSYAIKASSPLGYSVFFQRPGEGFSFQRHVEHKVEIFHVLSASPGSYAFICDYDVWSQNFESRRFRDWLTGTADPVFDRHRYSPEPGDVLVIDRLNVVHTVVGCLLEEFATVSTDMVDRLFDQNVGKPIPSDFSWDRMDALLSDLPSVEPRRILDITASGVVATEIVPRRQSWGEIREMSAGPLTARHLLVDANSRTGIFHDSRSASSLFVRGGCGILAFSGESLRDAQPDGTVSLAPGTLTMIPRAARWSLVSSGSAPLRVSEQAIPPETAFVTSA
jgi:mannose-6-phosphate isomerase-like protein (cupin superfamily)